MELLRSIPSPSIVREVGRRKRELALRQIEKRYKLFVNDPNLYLNEVVHIASKNPDSNLILYFNHISYADPVFILWFYFRHIDPDKKRRIILPGSHWHTNPIHNPFFATAYYLGEAFFGYKGVRIVQTYQLRQPEKYQYADDYARRTYRQLLGTIGKNPQNTTFIFAPEGHRSEEACGALQMGESGVKNFVRRLSPCVLVPVGIIYEGLFDRSGLNFGKQVNLNPAQPFYCTDRRTKVTLEQIMRPLASVLPPQMQGVWGPTNISK